MYNVLHFKIAEAVVRGTTKGFRTHGMGPQSSRAMMGVPWRGRTLQSCVLRTSCCYGASLCLLFLWPLYSSSYTNCMKTIRGLPAPHGAVSLALTIIMLDLFQALLLEQINDSSTTHGKNLEIQIVSNDHRPYKAFETTDC